MNGITPGFQGQYIGNINDDPLFVGTGEYPYSLSSGSPCIDTGWTADWYLISEMDLAGNERVLDGDEDGSSVIDMGAYEYQIATTSLVLGKESPRHLIAKEELSYKVFPNPTNSNLTIEFFLKDQATVQFSVLDIHGRIVYEMEPGELQSEKNQLRFNAGHLPAGLYLCRLQIGNEAFTNKIVKLR